VLPLPRHEVHAHHSRLLTGHFGLQFLSVARLGFLGCTFLGCTGPLPDLTEVADDPRVGVPVSAAVRQPVQEIGDFGPDILLPAEESLDEEVARVGDRVLRKSHVFDRLLTASPQASLEVIDLLILDILVAERALALGIVVDPQRVESLARAEEDGLREQVAQFGEQIEFETYVKNTFQMSLEEYSRFLRIHTAQLLYYGYAIRFSAMLEDRVQVRFLANQDRAVVEDLVDRVSKGADFATLARRFSEDDRTSRDGGLLPPFGTAGPEPIAEPAMKLREGELSPIIEAEAGGIVHYYLVYCLKRFERRQVTFEEVRQELDEDLMLHPVTKLEREAFALRYRTEMESGKPKQRP
jgi:parvulin-like peptidyl-prolyl isomerase